MAQDPRIGGSSVASNYLGESDDESETYTPSGSEAGDSDDTMTYTPPLPAPVPRYSKVSRLPSLGACH